MEGSLIDFKQESSVDPSGSKTPSPLTDVNPAPNILSSSNHIGHSNKIKSETDRLMSKPGGSSGKIEKKDANAGGKFWPWSKRDRLKRAPSLDKLDEEVDRMGLAGNESGQDGKTECSDYFGVKSYLHHFYEWSSYKDPDLYEEDWGDEDTRRLLYPGGSRRGRARCGWICWKVFAFIGVCLLLIGAASVLVGYLVPTRETTVGFVSEDEKVVDRYATNFNEKLDLCKIVGLIVFCVGGLTLTISLMVPSILYRYCDDERKEPAFSVQSGDLTGSHRVSAAVPATSKPTEIQPTRKGGDDAGVGKGAIVEAYYGPSVPPTKR